LLKKPLKIMRLPQLKYTFFGLCLLTILIYVFLWSAIGLHAQRLLHQTPLQKADIALVLGNRAYLHEAPNPCLMGRVDAGVALAKQGLVSQLLMSGGRDSEDGMIEAQVMQSRAQSQGFTGNILLESQSRSTLDNLTFSRRILEQAHIKNIIIVSEPYHLWRAQKLVEAGHLGRALRVQYYAAQSQCWLNWGMVFKGALREPLAMINNVSKGYFKPTP
jgi:uncharacterized SAM-binding protein YcdF (DUF218 family)